jgi:hypothetical protein
MVGYWRFDGGSGYGVVPDESGQGNTATLVALDTELNWLPGKFMKALRFGTENTDRLEITPKAPLNALKTFTFAAWINMPRIDARRMTMLAQQSAGAMPVFDFFVAADGRLSIGLTTGTQSATATANQAVALNQWTHVAATYDGATLTLYQNGGAARTFTLAGDLAPSQNKVIVGNVAALTQVFAGLIDELLIYTRALPPSAIQALAGGQQPASRL